MSDQESYDQDVQHEESEPEGDPQPVEEVTETVVEETVEVEPAPQEDPSTEE